MRVLVTRPEPASARTAAELERRGHEPVLLPLIVAAVRGGKLTSGLLLGLGLGSLPFVAAV